MRKILIMQIILDAAIVLLFFIRTTFRQFVDKESLMTSLFIITNETPLWGQKGKIPYRYRTIRSPGINGRSKNMTTVRSGSYAVMTPCPKMAPTSQTASTIFRIFGTTKNQGMFRRCPNTDSTPYKKIIQFGFYWTD